MQKVLLFIDRVSTWVGQAFSWLIVVLTFFVSWEVFSRYALDAPHAWAFDAMAMLYGTLFMMAGATRSPRTATCAATCSTASSAAHAGDHRPHALHRLLPARRLRAHLCGLLLCRRVVGDQRALQRDRRRAAGLSVQDHHPDRRARSSSRRGIVEIVRCVICLKQGVWPSREQDVEEVDVDKLKKMVHVTDADIRARSPPEGAK
jgi:hypothetical protein